ncbi:MAG: methylated-DNA--[protein]-cysteine S-methyltransferase [Nitrospiraceae bacterium]|nr:methylated-DNA--[protein]-cysteine S-methyltransferase [Nitrospiraceae bacterium]
MNTFFDRIESPFGVIYLLLKDGKKLAGVSFGQRPQGVKRGAAPALLISEFNAYFAGGLREFKSPVVLLSGTQFEQDVWLCLREIPYGGTRTYKWVSERVGRPGASRAVGQALSRNPIPLVLPCHRVIESNGGLGGYSPSVEIKRRILDMEYYHSLLDRPADAFLPRS